MSLFPPDCWSCFLRWGETEIEGESGDEAKRSQRHTMSLFCTSVSLRGRVDVRILSRLFVRMILHTYLLEPLQAQTLAIYRRMARSLIHAQRRPALQMTIIKDSQSNHLPPSPGSHSNILFLSQWPSRGGGCFMVH